MKLRLPVPATLLLTACASGGSVDKDSDSPPLSGAELVAFLVAPGPWHVGYAVDEVTWSDPLSGEARTLRLALWYPSEDTTGTEVRYAGLIDATGVLGDAAPVDGPLPLAVFSHGHQGYAENSGFLMEHLASHGWAVAAPDHTGNTTFDDPERRTAIYYQRPLDISAVLNHLEGPDHPLAGRLSDAPVLALGHSFGGFTLFALAGATFDEAAIAACTPDNGDGYCSDMDDAAAALFRAGFQEPRIGAYVAMAPGDLDRFGAAGLGAIEAPFLHMTATEDQPAGSEGDAIWAALDDGDDLGVILEGGGHQSFTDFSDILEAVPLDAQPGFDVVNAYALGWGLRLGGDTAVDEILDGSMPVSDVGTVR